MWNYPSQEQELLTLIYAFEDVETLLVWHRENSLYWSFLSCYLGNPPRTLCTKARLIELLYEFLVKIVCQKGSTLCTTPYLEEQTTNRSTQFRIWRWLILSGRFKSKTNSFAIFLHISVMLMKRFLQAFVKNALPQRWPSVQASSLHSWRRTTTVYTKKHWTFAVDHAWATWRSVCYSSWIYEDIRRDKEACVLAKNEKIIEKCIKSSQRC